MRANSILYFSILLIVGNAKDIKAQTIDSLAFIEGITILFESAEDRLTTNDEVQIDNLISKHLNTTLYRIEGHTDDVGKDSDNFALSQDRAYSVMEYLSVDGGIKASRIKFKGYGEAKPKVPNDSTSNRNKNRRTDFLIL